MKRKQRKQKNRKENSRGRNAQAKGKLLYLAVIGVLVAALVAIVGFNGAGFSGAGGNSAPEVMPQGTLTTDGDFHNFGNVSMGNGKVSYTFRLKNPGTEPALIRKLQTS